jgi:hypothetical protein
MIAINFPPLTYTEDLTLPGCLLPSRLGTFPGYLFFLLFHHFAVSRSMGVGTLFRQFFLSRGLVIEMQGAVSSQAGSARWGTGRLTVFLSERICLSMIQAQDEMKRQ